MSYSSAKALYVALILSLSCRSDPVIKPAYDTRSFSTYTLQNGISVLSVSHPESRLAAAAVGVAAGYSNDPLECQGLAHLLEHSLFLGTKSHPEPDSFGTALSQYNGFTNAATGFYKTVYRFDIEAAHFDEGLERFSELFTEPLLNEYSKKEISAVQSEYEGKSPRLDFKRIGASNYMYPFPFNSFGAGSLTTLKEIPEALGIDVNEYLRDFYRKYYCGQNMFLVTMSPESLESQRFLVERVFGNVDSTNSGQCRAWRQDISQFERPRWDLVKGIPELAHLKDKHTVQSDEAFSSKKRSIRRVSDISDATDYPAILESFIRNGFTANTLIQVVGGAVPELSITWIAPSVGSSYKEDRICFYPLESLLNRYEGSLYWFLSEKAWIFGIDGICQELLYFTSLGITIRLTDLGLTHAREVVAVTMAYVNELRTRGLDMEVVDSWVKRSRILFDQRVAVSNSASPAKELVEVLMDVRNPNNVLAADSIFSPNATHLQEMLTYLTPQRAFFLVADKQWDLTKPIPEGTQLREDVYDPLYDVKYRVSSIDKKLIDDLSKYSFRNFPPLDVSSFKQPLRLSLSAPIRHLPEHLSAVNETSEGDNPQLVLADIGLEVWWRGAGKFPHPTSAMFFHLTVPDNAVSVKHSLARRLFSLILDEAVRNAVASFTPAGYAAFVSGTPVGFSVEVEGHHDINILRTLVTLVATTWKEFTMKVSEREYQRWRSVLMKRLNSNFGPATVEQVVNDLRYFFSTESYPPKQQLDLLKNDKIFESYSTLATFVRTSMTAVYTRAYSRGLSKDHTIELTQSLLRLSGLTAISLQQTASVQTVPFTGLPMKFTLQNPRSSDHDSAAVIAFIWPFPISIEDRVHLHLLQAIVYDGVFNILRTEKQLGYIVRADLTAGIQGLILNIGMQGRKLRGAEQLQAIEDALEVVGRNLVAMTEEEAQKRREAYKSTKHPALTSHFEETSRHWSEIAAGHYCFEFAEEQYSYLVDDKAWKSAKELLINTFRKLTRPERRITIISDPFSANTTNVLTVEPDRTLCKHWYNPFNGSRW